ncbi:MAG: SEC-C metal-binding domain-containing protein, partial [Peptostreptococcaceae bacterium]
MLGRNELCPCGSGMKYKRCCLNKDVVLERAERKVVISQKQYSELYARIYEYSKQDKFKEEYQKAKKSGISAGGLREDDSIANITFLKNEELLLITQKGMSIRFKTDGIGSVGRIALGVRGIRLA